MRPEQVIDLNRSAILCIHIVTREPRSPTLVKTIAFEQT